MLGDIVATPRAKELYQQLRGRVYFTRHTIEAFFTHGEPDSLEVTFKTNSPAPAASWLVGRGRSLEAALEDYLAGLEGARHG